MRWMLLLLLLVGCGEVTTTGPLDAAGGAAGSGGAGGGGAPGADAGQEAPPVNPCAMPVLAALDGTATYVPGSQRATDPLTVVGDHTCDDAVARLVQLSTPVATLRIVDGVAIGDSGNALDTQLVSSAPTAIACSHTLRITIYGSTAAERCTFSVDYALSVPR